MTTEPPGVSLGAATRVMNEWAGALQRFGAQVWATLTGKHTSAKS
jgi:hypothetical protein